MRFNLQIVSKPEQFYCQPELVEGGKTIVNYF
jgi:hypothetical protein